MQQAAPSETVDADQAARPTALNCLVIVARHHGVTLSVEEMLHAGKLKSDWLTTDQLLSCARRAGFRCKTLFVKWLALDRLERFFPAIVRLKDGSSMVLHGLRVDDGIPVAILQDPNAGADALLVLDRIRFEQAWTGDVILVRRQFRGARQGNRFGWAQIADLVLREKKPVRDLVLSALALSFLALTPLIFVRLLIERVLLYRSTNTLIVLCLVLAVLTAMETAFAAMRRFTLIRLTAHVDARLATALYDKMLALPISYFETHPLGDTVYRMGQLDKVRRFFGGELFGTLLDAGILVFFLPLALYISPLLTLVTVLVCALVVGCIAAALGRGRPIDDAVARAEARRASFLAQTLSGIRTVKSLALDPFQRDRASRLAVALAGERRRSTALLTTINAIVVPLDWLLVAGTLTFGVYLSSSLGHPAQIGTLLLFYLLMQRLLAPLRHAAALVGHYQGVRSGIDAVGDLMNHRAETERTPAGSLALIEGHVAFRKVTFTYGGAAGPALRDVSFEVPAGTTLGIVGRSGSGKTTIARLLQRLYADAQGVVTLDGVDVRDIDIDHLRRSVAVVSQDSMIFRGTIRESITAARADATFEEMTAAARLAGADEFIDKLPRGYETMIQEGVPNLSVGQRQRLALARALITNPRVLILDEATSALDGDIEAVVNANLRHVARGRTVIIVSHRLAALMAADAIMVLEDGEVVDIGRHHDLVERCDLYSSQWHRQNAHLENETAAEKFLALS